MFLLFPIIYLYIYICISILLCTGGSEQTVVFSPDSRVEPFLGHWVFHIYLAAEATKQAGPHLDGLHLESTTTQ